MKKYLIYLLVLVSFVASIIFVNNNHELYDRTIVQVTDVTESDKSEVKDQNDNEDYMVTQQITARILNGADKGETMEIENQYSGSQSIHFRLKEGTEFFLANDGESVGTIKRDKYLLFVAWLFVLVLLWVGRKQGAWSVVSLAVNAVILSVALDIYIRNSDNSLLIICGISIILFTILSLIMASGWNEKTLTAIIATLIATFASLLIAYLALLVTDEQGLRYEEMSFLTRNPHLIFMGGLLIGSLGAVMDVAITMASSMFELFDKNNKIKISTLRQSGLEIGKDIMGTMTNILFFAYVSGTIPALLLYFMNAMPLGFTLSMNLSLELARALAGGIGIVITIPITLYISIFFIKRKQARQ
ncbi:YibE/F family protein [Gracilibacillus caseinilyticus]|uniref:YibE/F family protein n=1 Tax=Gracilibacillus caseinilyticus TaxID=2932256 RepID=A0ABY4F1D9_9BACI|nr:YibE/F family protein [Gracilibacillus caseinilyticus]UOQ49709.1 YibE/F family protein [Gracilibacillus caseinilyticus]